MTTSTTTALRRRAVFLDVDGTLMKDGRWIPPSAIDAVQRARAQGHLVFLSTGRGMAELRGDILDIGFDGAVSNGGGFATLFAPDGDEIVSARLIGAAAVARLEDAFRRHSIHWYFQSYDRMFAGDGLPALMAGYVERDRAAHAETARAAGLDPAEVEFFSVGMKRFDEPSFYAAADVAKAVILSDDADAIGRALDELRAEFAVVAGTIPLPTGSSGEVAPAGVHKGSAILALLAHVGIDPADAIGIGDNWNDAEMFEVCGLSIAMGNAAPAVQALADEVTTALDDDGIRNAFERHNLV